MTKELPYEETPKWIADFADNPNKAMSVKFPLSYILNDSLFYPASGLDGVPVKNLAGKVHSFVFADYAISKEKFLKALKPEIKDEESGFLGYQITIKREVFFNEISPYPYQPSILPTKNDGRLSNLSWREVGGTPFAYWCIFKRKDNYSESHGPKYFSLFITNGEACATYDGLYVKNKIKPKILFFKNQYCFVWTDLEDNNGFFKKIVRINPAGMPDYLIHSSYGFHFFDKPKWEEYNHTPIEKIDSNCITVFQLNKILN